jgi:hypothetical protein
MANQSLPTERDEQDVAGALISALTADGEFVDDGGFRLDVGQARDGRPALIGDCGRGPGAARRALTVVAREGSTRSANER